MVKDLVANSPFINLEFIEAGEMLNESNVEKLFDYYKIDSGGVSFNLHRDFVDYRITPFFSTCLLYTSPSPRDRQKSRMPSSA